MIQFKPINKFLISLPSIQSHLSLQWVSTKSTKCVQFLHYLIKPEQSYHDYELSLVSALKSCTTQVSVSHGQQIHCLILKSGLNSNTFIHNSLINMYAKCGVLDDAKLLFYSRNDFDTVSCNILISAYVRIGLLDDACKLFDEMPKRGCVSYTTMILGFAKQGCWREVVDVYKQMRGEGVLPSDVTMGTVVTGFYHLGGGIWDCRMIHGLVIKLLLDGFVLVSTNLVHLYCSCLRVNEARVLFDEMSERSLVSWNVMLNGYSKAGLVDKARELFDSIPDKDVVSWATVIDGYVRTERFKKAFTMFRSMIHLGLEPNEVMMVDLVSACAKKMMIGEGQQLHNVAVKLGFDCYDFVQATIIHLYAACGRINEAYVQFKTGIDGHVPSWNALISGYIKNKMIDEARKSFDEMPDRDVFTWSTMISGYSQEQPNEALNLFHRMVANGFRPNEVTMVSVLSSIASLGNLQEGKWAHEYVINNSIPLNDNLSAAIIDLYAKCGSIDRALQLFNQIQDNTSTVSPWNAIICGLAMHGHAQSSLKIYSDLLKRCIKPNSITFIGVLSACCHAGLVDLGENYFNSMKNTHNIDPDIKHYGCMVDLLGRAGRFEEAEKLIETMPMKADIVIWGALLAACRMHGNVDLAKVAAENLAELDSSHGASRVLLSNIYADAGMWEDAFLVRRAIQNQKMPRLQGFSEIT